jgi:hypothetical protein
MQNGRASARTRKLAIPALVILAHGAVLWSIAHRIPLIGAGYEPADDSRAVEVDLELQPRPKLPAATPAPQRPARAVSPPSPRPSLTAPPADALASSPQAAQPNVDADKDEGVRRALGQVLACNSPDSYGLTREQRTDCFRKARPAAPIPHPFDPREIAAFEADRPRESILVRKPHNGCLPRAGERAPPMKDGIAPAPGAPAAAGPAGSAAARTSGGFGCALAF